jgi:hypothetical protein
MKRRLPMKIPILEKLAHFIVSLMESEAPVVGKAAASAALATAESDPKVQAVTEASVAFLAAAKDLKAAANAANVPTTK